MKHVVLHEPGRFGFGDSPDVERADDEAIVRIHRVGVCGTDIHAFYGRQPFFEYPRILGHELGVEIVEAPPECNLQVGDHCAVEPYLNDPDTQASRRGKPNCCDHLKVLGIHIDGGLRPYISVPVEKLHQSRQLTLDQLALVETLCIGAHATSRARIGEDDNVLVIGAGPIGLSVLEFAKEKTQKPIAVMDISPQRLQFVRENLGIPDAVENTSGLKSTWDGDLPTIIFDATGNSKSMHGTFDLAAQGATIVFVGLFQGDVQFHDPLFHRKELTLLSSRNATPGDFRHVISSIEEGNVDTTPWLTHRIDFEQMPDAFEPVIQEPSLVKAVIELSGS